MKGFKGYRFKPPKLTQVTFSCRLICISLASVIGTVGLFGAGLELGMTPENRSMLNVFKAAPLSSRREVPIVQPLHLKAPPAYVMSGAVMRHPLQSSPSRAWTSPSMLPPFQRTWRGGTIGSAPAISKATRWPACTRVDVWMSKSMANAQQTPTINDPNASVTLDTTPPSDSSQGHCTTWVYHYGNPPSKKLDSRPGLMLVGSPKGQLLPQ